MPSTAGIYLNTCGYFDGSGYLSNWNDFYAITKNWTDNHPDIPIIYIGNNLGPQEGAMFRMQYYSNAENTFSNPSLPSVIPEFMRGKTTLSRWSPEFNSYVELYTATQFEQLNVF